MISNKRGSVLVITIAFVLIFTILGMAAIHVTTVHSEYAQHQQMSQEALWLADAGVQRVLHRLRHNIPAFIPKNTPDTSIQETLGPNAVGYNNRSYSVSYYTDPNSSITHPSRWAVEASGTVNNQTRRIHAEISRYDINNAITTDGLACPTGKDCPDDTDDCYMGGSGTILGPCKQLQTFDFETVLGVSKNQLWTMACDTATPNHCYDNDPSTTTVEDIPTDSSKLTNMANLTYLKYTNAGPPTDLHISNTSTSTGIIIIDARDYTGTPIEVKLTGGVFRGIIWTIGTDVKIVGGGSNHPNVAGTIFIEKDIDDTKLNGGPEVFFDPDAIWDALHPLNLYFSNWVPRLVIWREV